MLTDTRLKRFHRRRLRFGLLMGSSLSLLSQKGGGIFTKLSPKRIFTKLSQKVSCLSVVTGGHVDCYIEMNNIKYSCKSILFFKEEHTVHIYIPTLDVRRGEGDVVPSRASFLLNFQRMDVYSSASKYLLKTKGVAIHISAAWVVVEFR